MRLKKCLVAMLVTLGIFGLFGCGDDKAQQATPQEVLVNAFTAFTSDTPLLQEYSGSIIPYSEVPVQARVSGYITEKYVKGGQYVEAGQPLYRIDSRQYESALVAAQANTAQARANYENSLKDLERYRLLIAEGAISDQQLQRQQALVEQYAAMVEASEAQVSIASDNVDDTIVRAPFSGTLGVNDLPVGNFVAAGATPLVTISSTAPVYVQFNLTEAEYLKMATQNNGGKWGTDLKLRLSDGSVYDETGEVAVVDQGSAGSAGRFTVKASFPNNRGILRPGMFVNIISDTQISHNSVLIPTKSIQPLLDKEIVSLVDAENKVSQRPVKTGGSYGQYTIVTQGLQAGDIVVVEGQGKIRGGQTVQVNMLDKEQIENDSAVPMKAQ